MRILRGPLGTRRSRYIFITRGFCTHARSMPRRRKNGRQSPSVTRVGFGPRRPTGYLTSYPRACKQADMARL
jgi:hypothetical protein